MLPQKIEKWISNEFFPQRVLLSGKKGLVDTAIKIAAQLQKTTVEKIHSGIATDTFLFKDDGTSVKIGNKDHPEKNSVRGIIKWISQKPVSLHRIIILENFERMSRDAPHAILKILEEPPSQAIFIFTTQNHHQMLETILSRMTVLRIGHDFEDFEIAEDVKSFFQSKNLIWKFKKIKQLDKESKKEKDKSIILNFMNDLLIHARFFEQYQKHLEILFETQKALMGNVNTKLILECLALKLTK
ncbi:hypothetical protein KAI58_02565 [Candidatus Gracilibacteria bacterium]|nr:hypothetical protein [Candidatus Gracilibacteria bacterium]